MGSKSEQTGLVSRFSSGKVSQYRLAFITAAAIIVIYLILNALTQGRFLTGTNMLFVLTGSVVPTLIVLCFTFIFTIGITDLSAGAVMILASNAGGILALELGLGYFGLIVGSVVVAVLLQLLNLKIMLVSKLPPWIFGLGAIMVYEGIGALYSSYKISQGQQVVSLGKHYRGLGAPPWNVVVLIMALVIAYIIYNRTSVGFGLRSVGSNSTVAKMMGINVPKTILQAGLAGGIFLGLASAVNESYAGRFMPITGLNSIATIFTALAAFLLANALQKAFNITISAVISAFLITSLFNVLTILGVPSGTMQQVVMGASVIICGIISNRKFTGVVK